MRRLDNVRMSYENDGLTSRTHGDCNCRPHNGFTTHKLIHTVTYIKNYAETDLCWLCQRNNRTISGTTNLSESVKQQVNF